MALTTLAPYRCSLWACLLDRKQGSIVPGLPASNSSGGKKSFGHIWIINQFKLATVIIWLNREHWAVGHFLCSQETGRCLIRHLKATVNLCRSLCKGLFNQLSDLQHQLISIHTYYLSLIKAFGSNLNSFPFTKVLMLVSG